MDTKEIQIDYIKKTDFINNTKPTYPTKDKYYLDAIDKTKQQVLMSHEEFVKGGKAIKGVPITITPDGAEPEIRQELEGIDTGLRGDADGRATRHS
jgi:hypothetical protein